MGNHLETNRVLRVRVDLVLVDDLPETSSFGVNSSLTFNGVLQDGSLGVEAISVQVIGMANRLFDGLNINLSDSVLDTVNHGVNTHGEEMLMVLGIDLRGNHGAEGTGGFIFSENVGIDFASSLDFVVDGTVLVQVPVASIIVVGNFRKRGLAKKMFVGCKYKK